ncbi:MAG: glycoside hydrolase family 2 protein, partial [Anaerolineae bacterium]|nr:glycoside hydrolase family 2 protein [Anaerolineae bacterium]
MNQLSLNGAWTLTRPDQPQWELPAQVPGCVHLDLLTGGELQDPYYRDNEKAQFWVGETDWVYRRSFEVSPELLAHEQVLLRAHGLDTLAHVRLNGEEIGYADNMYRTWEWDIKAQLKPGANEVEIYFDAPMTYARRMDAERGEMAAWVGNMRLVSGAWIRKEPCNFGWDWGPKCVTSGIWRSLELIAFDSARLSDVLILQDHTKPERVKLDVRGSVEQASSAGLAAVVTIMLDGKKIVSTDPLPIEANTFTAEIVIDDPQLWWVNGMGEQPLYTVTVQLCKGDQEV